RPSELIVWEQPVTTLRALIEQRLRWAEGSVRRDLWATWPAVVGAPIDVAGRLDLVAYAGQALTPWVAIGLAARLLGPRRRSARGLIRLLTAAYATGAVALALVAIDAETGHRARPTGVFLRARRIGMVTVFGGI